MAAAKDDIWVDEIYHYKGLWEAPSFCGIKVIRQPEKTIVILTDLYDENPGTTVTEWIVPLVKTMVDEYQLDLTKDIVIQHTPDIGSSKVFYQPEFDRIEVLPAPDNIQQVTWHSLTEDEIRILCNISSV